MAIGLRIKKSLQIMALLFGMGLTTICNAENIIPFGNVSISNKWLSRGFVYSATPVSQGIIGVVKDKFTGMMFLNYSVKEKKVNEADFIGEYALNDKLSLGLNHMEIVSAPDSTEIYAILKPCENFTVTGVYDIKSHGKYGETKFKKEYLKAKLGLEAEIGFNKNYLVQEFSDFSHIGAGATLKLPARLELSAKYQHSLDKEIGENDSYAVTLSGSF